MNARGIHYKIIKNLSIFNWSICYQSSLTSRDTYRESQNPSVIKIFGTFSKLGSLYLLLQKSWSQKIDPFQRYFIIKKQVIWSTNIILATKLKNQTAELLEMNGYMGVYIYLKISIIAFYSLGILQIQYWELLITLMWMDWMK